MKTRKHNKIICTLNTQDPGAYTEKEFLKWLNSVDLKQHCKYWDQYKKRIVPDWKEKPCPSDPNDVEGWMKHYSAKYTTPKQCTQRKKRVETLDKRTNKIINKVGFCYEKQCGKITKLINKRAEEAIEPCKSLKEYSILSRKWTKSPKSKCERKRLNAPNIKELRTQRDTCEKMKCKKEEEQRDLHLQKLGNLRNATEQKE